MTYWSSDSQWKTQPATPTVRHTAPNTAAREAWQEIRNPLKKNSLIWWTHKRDTMQSLSVCRWMGLTCLRGNHLLVAHGDESMQDESHTRQGGLHCPATHTQNRSSVWSMTNKSCKHTHLISELASSTQTHRQPRTSSIAPCCLATAEFAPTLHGERVKWVCVGIGVCLCVFSYITTASRCECVMINPQNDFFD